MSNTSGFYLTGNNWLNTNGLNLSNVSGISPNLYGISDNRFFSNYSNNDSGTHWFGKDGYIDMASQGLAAISSGLNAWNGLQALKLAKRQFEFEKNLTNKNYEAQKKQYNNAIENRRAVGLALMSSAYKTPDFIKRYNAETERMKII